MAKLQRNDPCYCRSGAKYKHCHLAIDAALPEARLGLEQRRYAERWSANASSFAAQGCYAWMAEKACERGPEVMFDVGCGDGRGLAALLAERPSMRVLAGDENQACLDAAAKRISEAGFSVEVVDRCSTVARSDGRHSYAHGPLRRPACQVTLFRSDVVTDPHLEHFLLELGGVDLVTIWLIGTHMQRDRCSDLDRLGIRSSGEYRLVVQNQVYKLAGRVLRPNGVLQVVDRGEVPRSRALQADFIAAHLDQAASTSLSFTDFEWMDYEEPTSNAKVAMVETRGLSGRAADLSSTAMQSIRFEQGIG
jgi:SAM-dependent methyltransferase